MASAATDRRFSRGTERLPVGMQRAMSCSRAETDLPIRDDVVYAIRARTRAHINKAQIVLRGRTGCAAGGSEDAQGPAIWRPRLRVGRLRLGSGTARSIGALVTVVRWSCRSTRPGNLAAASPARVRLSSSDAFPCPEAGWAGDDRGAAYAGLRQAAIRRGCGTAARAGHLPEKAEASRWLSLAEAELVRGTFVHPSLNANVTVAEWLEEWRASHSLHKRPTTLVRDESAIRRHLVPRLGDVQLAKLRPNDVQAFVADLRREVGPGTTRSIYGANSDSITARRGRP